MYPFQTVAVSAPAQWIGPIGSRSAEPFSIHAPGGRKPP